MHAIKSANSASQKQRRHEAKQTAKARAAIGARGIDLGENRNSRDSRASLGRFSRATYERKSRESRESRESRWSNDIRVTETFDPQDSPTTDDSFVSNPSPLPVRMPADSSVLAC